MWDGVDDTMQGLGCPGGCQGVDGRLYQWVQGVDGLGNTVGYWRQAGANAPGAPYARNATPFLGDVAQASDGSLYQWVQGVDGLGNAFGFWKRLGARFRKLAKHALPIAQKFAPFVPGGAAALTAAMPLLKQAGVAGVDGLGALYEAPDGSLYQVAGVGAGDDLDGIGADELDGFAADELDGFAADELDGFAADELNGFAADDLDGLAEEMYGIGAEDDLNGVAAGDDLDGFAEDTMDGIGAEDLDGIEAGDDLDGVGAEDDLSGFAADDGAVDGYVRGGMAGMDGFVPDGPRPTPAFGPSPHAPMWAPIW